MIEANHAQLNIIGSFVHEESHGLIEKMGNNWSIQALIKPHVLAELITVSFEQLKLG